MREIKPDGTGNFTVERIGWVAIFVDQSIGTGVEAITGDRGEPTMANLDAIMPGQQLLLPAAGRPDHEHIVIKNLESGPLDFSIEQIVFDGSVYRNYGGSKVTPAENPPMFEMYELGLPDSNPTFKTYDVAADVGGTLTTQNTSIASGWISQTYTLTHADAGTVTFDDMIGNNGDAIGVKNSGAGTKTAKSSRAGNPVLGEIKQNDFLIFVKDNGQWRAPRPATDDIKFVIGTAGTLSGKGVLASNYVDWKWCALGVDSSSVAVGAGWIPTSIPTDELKENTTFTGHEILRGSGKARISWTQNTRLFEASGDGQEGIRYIRLMN